MDNHNVDSSLNHGEIVPEPAVVETPQDSTTSRIDRLTKEIKALDIAQTETLPRKIVRKSADFQATMPTGVTNTDKVEVKKNSLSAKESVLIQEAVTTKNVTAISLLLEANVPVGQWRDPESGKTALHMLARQHDAEAALLKLIDGPCNLEAKDEKGRSALQLACIKGNYTAAIHLVSKGVELSPLESLDQTVVAELLDHAASHGKLEEFLGKIDIPVPILNSYLERKVSDGNTHSIRRLVEHGAGINAQNAHGFTVMQAALTADYLKIETIKCLVSLGADPIQALDVAVTRNNKELFKSIMKLWKEQPNHPPLTPQIELYAIKLNMTDKVLGTKSPPKDEPSLHAWQSKVQELLKVAMQKSDVEGVKALVKLGAKYDVKKPDENGWTEFHHALVDSSADDKKVAMLIALGADINALTPDQDSPLGIASVFNNTRLFCMLLDAGADLGTHTAEYAREAIVSKNTLILNALLEKGVTLPQEQLNKSLMLACKEGDLALMKKLIKAGANCEYRDEDSGKNIIHMAVDRAHSKDDFEVLLFVCEDLSLGNLKALLETKSDKNQTPLMQACLENDALITKYLLNIAKETGALSSQSFEIVEKLVENDNAKLLSEFLKAGVDINAQDSEGKTHLQRVMNSEPYSPERVELLLSLNAASESKNKDGLTLSDLALKAHDYKTLLSLVLQDKVKLSEKELFQVLREAVRYNRISDARILIEKHQANPHFQSTIGKGLLHDIPPYPSAEMLQFLCDELKLADKILDTPAFSKSPLDIARANEDIQACIFYVEHTDQKALLQQDPSRDISLTDQLFDLCLNKQDLPLLKALVLAKKIIPSEPFLFLSVLQLAVKSGDLQTVKALCQAKREWVPTSLNPQENIAFLAAASGNVDLLRYIMEDLRFADLYSKDEHPSSTPLHAACESGNEKAVLYLLSQDLPIDTTSDSGQTLLHMAAQSKSPAIVRLLLKQDGVQLEAKNISGQTPLHAAARHGDTESVQALLDAGCDKEALDDYDRTPYVSAKLQGNQAAIKAFLATGMKRTDIDSLEMRSLLKSLTSIRRQNPSDKIDFAAFLLDRGFTTTLKGIDLNSMLEESSLSKNIFDNVDFTGITFEDCRMLACSFTNSTFTNCSFKGACEMTECTFINTTFENCTFPGASKLAECAFINAKLSSCQFLGTNLEECRFDECSFEHVAFTKKCNLTYAGFNQSTLSACTFDDCTLMGANFLDSEVKASKIVHSDLKNCLLFGASSGFDCSKSSNLGVITMPTVAIAWNSIAPGAYAEKAVKSLKAAEAIPVKFNYLPTKINTQKLEKEVQTGLSGISRSHAQTSSRPQILLEKAQADGEISKLMTRAREISRQVDAILLPGGDDIQPEFYGQPPSDETNPEEDYRRTVYEFAVIREARQRGIPLMGICRGSQMGNIFCGGALRQDVSGQKNEKVMERIDPGQKGAVGTIRGLAFGKGQEEELKAASRHHQASRSIGTNLEVVIEYEGVVKAMEGKEGSPFMLLQFHPEYLDPAGVKTSDPSTLDVSRQNFEIIEGFRQAAQAFHKKKEWLGVQRRV